MVPGIPQRESLAASLPMDRRQESADHAGGADPGAGPGFGFVGLEGSGRGGLRSR